MEVIVDNTIKNASSRMTASGSRIKKHSKSVNFEMGKNEYFAPKEWNETEPIFFDIVSRTDSGEHPLHLDQSSSFEEKKHEEEFIEREDLLGLDEKSEELAEEGKVKSEKNETSEEKEKSEEKESKDEAEEESDETLPLSPEEGQRLQKAEEECGPSLL